MAIIKRKTRKAITKQINKLIKKHGPEIASALVSSLVTGITATAAVKSEDNDQPEEQDERDATSAPEENNDRPVKKKKKKKKKSGK